MRVIRVIAFIRAIRLISRDIGYYGSALESGVIGKWEGVTGKRGNGVNGKREGKREEGSDWKGRKGMTEREGGKREEGSDWKGRKGMTGKSKGVTEKREVKRKRKIEVESDRKERERSD